MSEKTSLVEQKRLRGRNTFDVVNQIVNEYNSSNGWALLKVMPNLLNFEVVVERSTKQSGTTETVVDTDTVVENQVETKPELEAKTTKKAQTNAAKKSAETKEV